jgi:hypothetical protein
MDIIIIPDKISKPFVGFSSINKDPSKDVHKEWFFLLHVT